MQAVSGRLAEELARHCQRVVVCARVVRGAPPAPFDAPLDAANLEIVEQPYWNKTAESLPHLFGFFRSYAETCRRVDALVVRGMCPYAAVLYLCAAIFNRPICHSIIGDPLSVLRASKRKGLAFDALARLYALQDRFFTRLGRWFTGGAFVCNGRELARAYDSPRTIEVVASTIREGEFSYRVDACQGPVVRILCVSFLRPEKGIEYLLEAASCLKEDIPWELHLVGPREFPEYGKKLDDIVAARGIEGRIRWHGYVPNGEPLWNCMRAADIFVLPTLSEGTPHVLVEARANGVPCISTTVGGVPSTVTDGHDALLVPPRDVHALARAIERVIEDGELRRNLIRNGLAAARKQTLDHFVSVVLRELDMDLPAESAETLQG